MYFSQFQERVRNIKEVIGTRLSSPNTSLYRIDVSDLCSPDLPFTEPDIRALYYTDINSIWIKELYLKNEYPDLILDKRMVPLEIGDTVIVSNALAKILSISSKGNIRVEKQGTFDSSRTVIRYVSPSSVMKVSVPEVPPEYSEIFNV